MIKNNGNSRPMDSTFLVCLLGGALSFGAGCDKEDDDRPECVPAEACQKPGEQNNNPGNGNSPAPRPEVTGQLGGGEIPDNSTNLSGYWWTGCLEPRRGETRYSDQFLVFDGGRGLFATVTTAYNDKACEVPLYSFVESGPYSTSAIETEELAQNLDLNIELIKLLAYYPEVADAFNAESLYGIDDWVAGEAQDLIGTTINGVEITTRADYTIFQIVDDDKLYIGSPSDSPDSRPDTLVGPYVRIEVESGAGFQPTLTPKLQPDAGRTEVLLPSVGWPLQCATCNFPSYSLSGS